MVQTGSPSQSDSFTLQDLTDSSPKVETKQMAPASSDTTQPSASADWKTYSSSEFGISFVHPPQWQCKTGKTHADHPDWYQTSCDDDGVWSGDPLLSISVPASPDGQWKGTASEIGETKVAGKNSANVTKTVYRSDAHPEIGWVEYVFDGSTNARSYSAFAMYGTGKPYATSNDASKILDSIVQLMDVPIRSNAGGAQFSNGSTATQSVFVAASRKFILPIPGNWRTEEVPYTVGGNISGKDILVYDENNKLAMKVTQPVREIGYESSVSTAQPALGTGIGALTTFLRGNSATPARGMMHYTWGGGNDFWNDSFEIFVYFGDGKYYKTAADQQANNGVSYKYSSLDEIKSGSVYRSQIEDMIGGLRVAAD
jgi:hypothetical protein